MVNPTKAADAQDACPLFKKLAPETRNQIYSLVFAAETSKEDDGSIELNESTAPPSKNIIMTCQWVHYEAQAMYKAAYRKYPEHVFTLDIPFRRKPTFIPSLSNDIFSRINTIRASFQAGQHAGDMHRLTTRFTRIDKPRRLWDIRVEMHDMGGRTARIVKCIINYLESMPRIGQREAQYGAGDPDEMLSYAFSRCAFFALYGGRHESGLWQYI
jgi:hypothetical protein